VLSIKFLLNTNLPQIQFLKILKPTPGNKHFPNVFFRDEVFVHQSFTVCVSPVNKDVEYQKYNKQVFAN